MLYFASGPVSLLACVALIALPLIVMWVDAILQARRSVESQRKPYQRWWVYIGVAVLTVFVEALVADLIRHYYVEAFYLPTGSMQNTLLAGDRFLVDRLVRRHRDPRHGEIVAHYAGDQTGQIYVRRVIGLPGDTIEIRDEQVFRNGKPLNEPYADFDDPLPQLEVLRNFGPHKVPAEKAFLLGDARRRSKDSRYDGDYQLADVVGIARVVYWSREYEVGDPRRQQPESWGSVRWNRIGLRLD
jgi:signal peptidase I